MTGGVRGAGPWLGLGLGLGLSLGLGLGPWMAGCTPVERPSTPTNEAPPDHCGPSTREPDAPPPVVTTLQTRDHEVTVHAGDEGLRFTVSLAGGELLGRRLTEAELEQSFPGLHQRFRSAFAGDDSWLDASVERSHATPLPATRSVIESGDPR